jgi:hypothetical protein
MKTIRQSSQRFSAIYHPALILGVALLLGDSIANARDFVPRRAAVAVAAGYGYGYASYAYSSANFSGAGSTGHIVSSLPSGYVATLPSDAAPVVVFGKTYYFSGGNYYSPVFYGGCTYYAPANP